MWNINLWWPQEISSTILMFAWFIIISWSSTIYPLHHRNIMALFSLDLEIDMLCSSLNSYVLCIKAVHIHIFVSPNHLKIKVNQPKYPLDRYRTDSNTTSTVNRVDTGAMSILLVLPFENVMLTFTKIL